MLVVGGRNEMGLLSTCELYDPAADSWLPTSSLDIPIVDHSATPLEDGNILVAGGASVDGPADQCRLFDPDTGTWRAAASLIAPRARHQATLLEDGRVLLTGGLPLSAESRCELYDPILDQWKSTAPMAWARLDHSATALMDGRVLVAGGKKADGEPVLTCEIFDATLESWSATGSLAPGRRRHTADLLMDGRVLLVGGSSAESEETLLTESMLYDPGSGAWSAAASLLAGRVGHRTIRSPRGHLLALGGSTSPVESYVPPEDDWISLADLREPRWEHTATDLGEGAFSLPEAETPKDRRGWTAKFIPTRFGRHNARPRFGWTFESTERFRTTTQTIDPPSPAP